MKKKLLDISWFNPNETYKEWARRKGLTLATFVNIPCANCGEEVEFQVTNPDSEDKTFNCADVPTSTAEQINGMSYWCNICGARVTAFLDNSEGSPMLGTFVD